MDCDLGTCLFDASVAVDGLGSIPCLILCFSVFVSLAGTIASVAVPVSVRNLLARGYHAMNMIAIGTPVTNHHFLVHIILLANLASHALKFGTIVTHPTFQRNARQDRVDAVGVIYSIAVIAGNSVLEVFACLLTAFVAVCTDTTRKRNVVRATRYRNICVGQRVNDDVPQGWEKYR